MDEETDGIMTDRVNLTSRLKMLRELKNMTDRVEEEIRFITNSLTHLSEGDAEYERLTNRLQALLELKNNTPNMEEILWK